MLNILCDSEARAANSTPHQSFRHHGFKLQALQFRRKVEKLISPKTHITQTGSVVTEIIPYAITTQWQPANSACVCFALLIAYIDHCLNTVSVTDGTPNHCFTQGFLPFRLYMLQPQQDGLVLLADSACPVESILIDNDAQRSSHSGRQTEKRMSGPICLCPKLKRRGSPPLLSVSIKPRRRLARCVNSAAVATPRGNIQHFSNVKAQDKVQLSLYCAHIFVCGHDKLFTQQQQ